MKITQEQYNQKQDFSHHDGFVLATRSEIEVDLNIGHVQSIKDYYNALLVYECQTPAVEEHMIRSEIDRVKAWLKTHKTTQI